MLHVCQTTLVQNAWQRGEELADYGWIYVINDGHLRDLGLCVTSPEPLDAIYRVRQSNDATPPLFRRVASRQSACGRALPQRPW